MEPKAVDKNLILDEAMKQINVLNGQLIVKTAYIRQLESELASLKEKKEETV